MATLIDEAKLAAKLVLMRNEVIEECAMVAQRERDAQYKRLSDTTISEDTTNAKLSEAAYIAALIRSMKA